MTLEKTSVVDAIEVLETGHVQVRIAKRISEDGDIISQAYERYVINPGDDYSSQDARVQAICAAVHTPAVVAAFKARQE